MISRRDHWRRTLVARQRQTRPTLQERDLIGANDMDNEGLGHQRFDEPAGLKERYPRRIPAVEDPQHDEEGRIVEN